MVCKRCIKVVETTLNELNIKPVDIRLGEVVLEDRLTQLQEEEVQKALKAEGFELLNNQQSKIISQIKSLLIELIHQKDLTELRENISHYLSDKMHKDYHYLSHLFSVSENVTIEQFVIQQKVEKIKELLIYDELTLSDIAFKMNYSSAAHLSAQFKKVTGFSPSQFKKLKQHKRKSLDEI